MSGYTYLSIHQCEGVVFDDVAKLNADLQKKGAGELLDPQSIQYWTAPKSTLDGFVKQESDGSVRFAGILDNEWRGYEDEWISVYGCIYEDEFKVIAKHMTAGKLVLRISDEGNFDEFRVLTPGKVASPEVKF